MGDGCYGLIAGAARPAPGLHVQLSKGQHHLHPHGAPIGLHLVPCQVVRLGPGAERMRERNHLLDLVLADNRRPATLRFRRREPALNQSTTVSQRAHSARFGHKKNRHTPGLARRRGSSQERRRGLLTASGGAHCPDERGAAADDPAAQ
eukprot:4428533-Prymnesium_polylepis.2